MNASISFLFRHCLILFFGFLLLSCSAVDHSILRKNQFSNGFKTIYYNDSLKIRIDFYGNTSFDKNRVSRNFRKKVHREHIELLDNQVLIGEYKYLDSPSLLLGSIQTDFDYSKYIRRESKFQSIYYYSIENCEEYSYSKICIPLSESTTFVFQDILLDNSKFSTNCEEEEKSIHFVFDNIRVGTNYDTDIPMDLQEFVESKFKSNGTSNYLLPVEALENNELYSDRDQYEDFLKIFKSFLGETQNYERVEKERKIGRKSRISLDSLVQVISDERVVMFNENHLFPSNRLLLNLCLEKLYSKGFTVLALEALGNDEKRVNELGFVNIESGFYTRDPQMANMIRNAVKLGYQVIDYEDFKDSKNRDLKQAKNILKKTRNLKNGLKLIVLAGGDHIAETKIDKKKASMAYYFQTFSGINPYTINQVYYLKDRTEGILEFASPPEESPYDMYLLNGLRPDSVFLGSNLEYREILFKYPASDTDTVPNKLGLYLYKANEYPKDNSAIPIHVRYFEKDVYINLPIGSYIFIVKTTDGTILSEKEISVQQ